MEELSSEIREPSTAVAFQGGGFRAAAAAAGWIAGMRASGKLSIPEVLSAKAIGCNSGGCWFMAPFLWSKRLNEMVEDMGTYPQQAQQIYMARYGNAFRHIAKWRSHSQPDFLMCCNEKNRHAPCGVGSFGTPLFVEWNSQQYCCPRSAAKGCRRKGAPPCGRSREAVHVGHTAYCCRKSTSTTSARRFNQGVTCLSERLVRRTLRSIGDQMRIFLSFFLGKDRDYQGTTKGILEIPGDVNTSLPLSSTPVEWAKGKDFILATTVLAPSAAMSSGVVLRMRSSILKRDMFVTAVSTNASAQVIGSWPCRGKLCGTQVPARFSVTLGSTRSPLPLTSKEAREALGLEYRILERPSFSPLSSSKSKGGGGGALAPRRNAAESGNWEKSHQVPISAAVGGSSALFGPLTVLKVPPMPWTIQKVMPTWLWARLVRGQVQFKANAPELTNANFGSCTSLALDTKASPEKQLSEVAVDHVLALSDGGTTDNLGVAHLVAAGHTNILAIFNSMALARGEWKEMGSMFNYLSDGPNTTEVGFFSAFPIFLEDGKNFLEQFSHFEHISAAADAVELSTIYAGELNLVTANAPAFGITGGKAITLRTVILDAKRLMCCGLQIVPYSILAGEIVQTLAANPLFAGKVQDWLAPLPPQMASVKQQMQPQQPQQPGHIWLPLVSVGAAVVVVIVVVAVGRSRRGLT